MTQAPMKIQSSLLSVSLLFSDCEKNVPYFGGHFDICGIVLYMSLN